MSRRMSYLMPLFAVAICAVLAGRADLAQENAADLVRPVRPGGVDGQAYWNELSVRFQYPPSFDFKPVEDAVSYRYVLEDDARRKYDFSAATPNESLASVWTNLPTGFLRLEVYGVNRRGRVLGVAGARRFWKSEPFSPALCPEPAWSYDTAVGKYFDWLFAMTNTQMLATTGETDEYYLYNTYPAKTESALVHAFLRMAERTPERRGTLIRAARNAADFLLAYSNPAGSPLEFFPHTYRVLRPESSRKGVTSERYEGQNMLIYPAHVGSAYLALYEVVKDGKYLTAAKRIAATYRRLQGEDGTWYLKLWEKDATPVAPNRLLPFAVCDFLEKLHALTGDAAYREMSDRAFAFVETGPLKTWSWEAQFEDTKPSRRFRNMSVHPPCDAALHLLARYPDDAAKRALARECLRFAEDQFVSWRDPFTVDGRGPMSADTTMLPVSAREAWYGLPSAFEQYDWYLPIDGSAAKVIRTYLAFYRLEGRALDLEKAKTLGNAVTQIQRIAGNGAIPTHWVRWDVESDAKHWINCGIGTALALEELGSVRRFSRFSAESIRDGR